MLTRIAHGVIMGEGKIVNGSGFSNIRIRYNKWIIENTQGNLIFNVQKHEMSYQIWHSTRHLLVFGVLDIYPTNNLIIYKIF